MKTLTASFVETTTSTLLTKPLRASGTPGSRASLADRAALHAAGRAPRPDRRRHHDDGLAVRERAQSKDIGAAQKRIQKYFVDSSPDELRSHFTIAARRRARRYLITMVPKRKQILEGLSRLELWVDRRLAADGGDADDVPERRHQADDVHRRQAERPDRSVGFRCRRAAPPLISRPRATAAPRDDSAAAARSYSAR